MNIRVDSLKENLRDFQFPSRPKFTLSVVEWPLCGEIDLFAVDSIMGQLYPSSLSEKKLVDLKHDLINTTMFRRLLIKTRC